MADRTLTSGFTASPQDDRDYWFAARPGAKKPGKVRVKKLPMRVDLLPWVNEVEDQGRTNSCVANAVVSAAECILAQQARKVDLSRLYVYWHARERSGIKGDRGSHIRLTLAETTKRGIPLESLWPFDTARVDVAPDAPADEDAATRLVTRYERCAPVWIGQAKKVHLNAVLGAVAQGLPVVFGIRLGEGFFRLSGPLHTHLAQYDPKGEAPPYNGQHAYHAMTVVGYDRAGEYLIVENSWGAGWGDGGFCAIGFDNFIANAFDAVCIREFDGVRVDNPPTWWWA